MRSVNHKNPWTRRHDIGKVSLIPMWGRVMQEYETTLTSRGTLSLLTVERHFSDAAAIHAAKKLRKNNEEKVEVWRGDVCVYAETPRKNVMLACP
jgi:hypothetical protein